MFPVSRRKMGVVPQQRLKVRYLVSFRTEKIGTDTAVSSQLVRR